MKINHSFLSCTYNFINTITCKYTKTDFKLKSYSFEISLILYLKKYQNYSRLFKHIMEQQELNTDNAHNQFTCSETASYFSNKCIYCKKISNVHSFSFIFIYYIYII